MRRTSREMRRCHCERLELSPWGMCTTMMGDITAFISIVFGYLFYWTARPDFPPDPLPDPGVWWPTVALGLLLGAWLCTLCARRWNRMDARSLFHLAGGAGVLLAGAGGSALVAGPWLANLDPTAHAYGATVLTA